MKVLERFSDILKICQKSKFSLALLLLLLSSSPSSLPMASERALRHPERHLERTELSVANLKFVLIFCQIDKISREICDMSEMSQEKKLVILEKRPKKDGRKCMIKSCQYQEENGWVTIPQNERRRKDFCEAIGVPSVQP